VVRILIVPRWGADASSDWYSYVCDRSRAGVLPGGGAQASVVGLAPTAGAPEIDACVEAIERAVAGEPESCVIVGHSVGSRAALHYLAGLPAERGVRGFLSVAGWWTIDEPWPSLEPWIERPLDVKAARRAAGLVRVLISDDDPYTADWGETKRLWEELMGAEVAVRSGGRHFNGEHEVAALIRLSGLIDDTGQTTGPYRTW
jgi:predicted alpha/beta hydrolase family esterase